MDDFAFPSYISSKARSRHTNFNEVGDAFVRELDVSRITLRLRQKSDGKATDKADNVIAKLQGDTLVTLKNCLNNPTVLALKDGDGTPSRIKVSLKYIPVAMTLDPSESINNMGDLRVNVLDATDLPAADRSGFSDPFCKFFLNDKEVFKTKVQKKTLQPAWNEFFETPVGSRTGADFIVKVYDWDFGDSPDFLGQTKINLADLEPFQPKDVVLPLDGKSGSIRLRLLFKSSYVTRSRQGSSTFSGTFATPGRVVTSVAGAPIKTVGLVGGVVGGGVVKGASFLRHGFKKRAKDEEGDIAEEDLDDADQPQTTPRTSSAEAFAPGSPQTPGSAAKESNGLKPAAAIGGGSGIGGLLHSRRKSLTGGSLRGDRSSIIDAGTGTANFTIVSATGFPSDAHVRVTIKQLASSGPREVHETKAIKESSGTIAFSSREQFKVTCTPAQQFQISVKDHSTFGRDKDLGETLFFVDDSNSGEAKEVKVGEGTITIKSSYEAGQSNGNGSIYGDASPKRSLTKKGLLSRESTPQK
jgi:hypothetical protein